MAESLNPAHLPLVDTERKRVALSLKEKAEACHARGELISAMLYASDALMLFPADVTYRDLVDGIAQSTDEPLSLVPVASGAVHVATAAVRARILFMYKRWDEALRIITEVVEVAPDLGYFDWLTRWLQPQVIETVGWDGLTSAVIVPLKIAMNTPTKPDANDPRLPNLRAAALYLPLIRQRFPEQLPVWLSELVVRRRLGDPHSTLAVAGEAASRFPMDWRVVTSLANALSDAGRCDEALSQARRAIELDPEDFSPLHDVAWGYLDAGRATEAVQLFTELLDRAPNYPARAALHYARVMAYNSPEDRQALLELRDSDWDNGDGMRLANRLDAPEPYYNYLPDTGDATTAAAREILKGLTEVMQCCGRGGSLNAEITSLYVEAPSVSLAFNVALRAAGAEGGEYSISAKRVQTPDPRAEKTQIAHRLWQFDGQRFMKALPPAHPNAQQAVGYLANQLYRTDVWSTVAQQIAGQFGPDWAPGFLSVLTDPPLPPQNCRFDGMTWTFRCQIAAAVILSHLGPWETSPGRHALYSVVYGPTDWITAAGLIAFAWRARLEPRLRPEVEAVFGWMRTQIPKEGYTVWEAPLAKSWLHLGPHAPPFEKELRDWIEEYEESASSKNRTLKDEPNFDAEVQQRLQLKAQGVSGEEAAALNEIRDGEMDMHLRMAQAQQAQRQVAEGNSGDPDPVVFPGQPVAKLSDYVGILKGMQTGDMMGSLARYGLDMMSYGAVATAWGAKMAADPVLTEKFTRMMQ